MEKKIDFTVESYTAPAPSVETFNTKHRKESHFYKQFTTITSNLGEVIIARFYHTGTRFYCCFWINSLSISGTGWSDYNDAQAFADALTRAGYTVSHALKIGGSSVEDALQALMRLHSKAWMRGASDTYRIFTANA